MLVKQVSNLIELLEYFVQRKRPATLTEISEQLEWPRSSTFNLIGTLLEKGYLYEPQIRKGYYPSASWLTLSQKLADAEPLPEALQFLVNDVAKETGETTAICAPAGTHVILSFEQESKHSIRYHASVGTRVPICASSAGRAILSQYSKKERLALYRKISFDRYTDKTPLNIEAVEDNLLKAKQLGYHQSESEYIIDLAGVALPIPLPNRRLSIVVAGPVSRCLGHRADIAEVLISSLKRYSSELGITSS